MKNIVLLFVLLYGLTTLSQEVPKDSIIYLHEVVISKSVKAKIKKIKTTGSTISSTGIQRLEQHVSLVKDLPAGYINSVTFYFNSGMVNLFKKDLDIKYEDTDLALVLYSVKKDGSPGAKITENEIRFTVKKDHKGAITLNVAPLNLHTLPQMFIGIVGNSYNDANSIVLKMQENPDAVTYFKAKNSNEWFSGNFGTIFLQ